MGTQGARDRQKDLTAGLLRALTVGDEGAEGFGPSADPFTVVLLRLGGVATRSQLLEYGTRADLRRALQAGGIRRTARGRYALATVEEALETAHALSGVLCLRSAALHHGWAVKEPPPQPQVILPKGRNPTSKQRALADVRRRDLQQDDVVDGIVTSKEATLRHCLRGLPWDEALAIADSALRAGEATLLKRVARTAQGPGAPRIRSLARVASADAANPFESVLRALALELPGLRVRPQYVASIEPWIQVDLADIDRRIVLEADSFEWHGDRRALRKDARRYDELVADGWVVLRFAWEDVMFDQEWVRSILARVVDVTDRRTEVPGHAPSAA